jgi:hypothetical protein
MTLWDDVRSNLVTWYGAAAGKTNELAKVGSRRYDIFGLSRDIERQLTEMGSLVYTALQEGRTDFGDDPVLRGLQERISVLEAELVLKKEEIESIRTKAQEEAGPDAASAAWSADVDDVEPMADAEVEIVSDEPFDSSIPEAEVIEPDSEDDEPEKDDEGSPDKNT